MNASFYRLKLFHFYQDRLIHPNEAQATLFGTACTTPQKVQAGLVLPLKMCKIVS